MRLRLPLYTPAVYKDQQREFGGVIARAGAQEGQIIEAYNMSTDEYPLLASRREKYIPVFGTDADGRQTIDVLGDGEGVFLLSVEEADNKRFVVSHYDANGNLLSEGYTGNNYTVKTPYSEWKLVRLADKVLIFPEMLICEMSVVSEKISGATLSGNTIVYAASEEPPFSAGKTMSVFTNGANKSKSGLYPVSSADFDPDGNEATITLQGVTFTSETLSGDEYVLLMQETMTVNEMGARQKGDVSITDGKNISFSSASSRGTFEAGYAIRISGCVNAANNTTLIARSVSYDQDFGWSFTVDDGALTDEDTSNVTVETPIPLLETAFICDNRLWGSVGRTIYASALGDPEKFYVYETDAGCWTVEIGGFEPVTAGLAFGGYPTFFTQTSIVKIYGAYPSAYQTVETPNTTGVPDGYGKSLAAGDGVLFWAAKDGIYSYTGSYPRCITEGIFNAYDFDNDRGVPGIVPFGRAAVVKGKYYLPVMMSGMRKRDYSEQDVWIRDRFGCLLVYDTARRAFEFEKRKYEYDISNREDPDYPGWGGESIYRLDCMDAGEALLMYESTLSPYSTSAVYRRGQTGEYGNETVYSYVKFDNLFDGSADRKHAISLQIRYYAKPVTVGTSDVSYLRFYVGDGDRWTMYEAATVGSNTGDYGIVIPLRPHRYDRLILKIEANCYYRIYDITRVRSFGSEVK